MNGSPMVDCFVVNGKGTFCQQKNDVSSTVDEVLVLESLKVHGVFVLESLTTDGVFVLELLTTDGVLVDQKGTVLSTEE